MAQQAGSGHIQVFENLKPREQRSMLVGVLIVVAIVMGVVNTLASGDTDWAGLADNFSTELMGAALTFFIFDLFQERRSDLQRKAQLIRELGSRSHDTAISALDELRKAGMVKNGSLQEVDLADANLWGVDLQGANLQRADLWGSNLERAKLSIANLRGADLQGVNLMKFDDQNG